jgi:glycerol-3-phosphate cytidylyltransferase
MGKIVLTYGTFDLFHIGHLNLIKRLRDIAGYDGKVIVGVSTDEFNKIKGKKSIIPFKDRIEIVKNIKGVDIVIPEKNWEQKVNDIKKYKVDVLVMGEDWKGKFDYLKEYCEVKYLPRTKEISSTFLRETLKNISVSKNKILEAFDVLEQLKKDLL